ncbi:MAG: hypothetical protein JSW06_01830 [Thermoplasmatales archaeon]|nr:MAG: hypothetical protein JSW06_01830 [Thermoplasmatales archaeon]
MDEKTKLSQAVFIILRYVFWLLDKLEKQKPGCTVAEISEVLKRILVEQPDEYGRIIY